MKKSLLILGLVSAGLAHAQEGKVGVNTETPKETLEVKGTAKVSELPISGSVNAIYNGNAKKTETFTGTRTVVANDDGVLGYVDGLPMSREIPIYSQQSKCVHGRFEDPAKRVNIPSKSEITMGNLMVRYNPDNAGASFYKIQFKTVKGTARGSAFLNPASTEQRFKQLRDDNWVNMVVLNYDAEGSFDGFILLEENTNDISETVLYRYSALGWKANAASKSGMCHVLERVAMAAEEL